MVDNQSRVEPCRKNVIEYLRHSKRQAQRQSSTYAITKGNEPYPCIWNWEGDGGRWVYVFITGWSVRLRRREGDGWVSGMVMGGRISGWGCDGNPTRQRTATLGAFTTLAC
ncbi:hypothetical protein [Muribaculum intestinale]|uniref:hypothetical protein n=1 Tax=Muribaculum intestinale TaxID=1796646 RepID=UPI00243327B5|nr:hypothetical protein [Muribaculum intestinale]